MSTPSSTDTDSLVGEFTAELEDRIRAASARPSGTWRPFIFRLSPDALPALEAACRRSPVAIVDTLDRQLEDLAAVRLPGGSPSERKALIEEVVGEAGKRMAYGNWILFPWDAKIVRLLPEEAFFEVITSRNHDKITPEEQRTLRSRRVGVMGLSVGAEAAVALAQEHLCGEIRLADFDDLELSNLNRIGAKVDDLGENKAVLAARRIAWINPYLRVTLFPEGVTEGNLDAFLKGLDLVVEECDHLPMKLAVRERARALGVNMVFAADERGFLSIEPYANRPDLEPFHGRVRHRPLPRESHPSPLAFMRSLTDWVGGWDQISERTRKSLEEIGRTRSGYPQLASEARYAAGQIGHVARRLLLGERLRPFVDHLDLSDLLPVDEPGTFGGEGAAHPGASTEA